MPTYILILFQENCVDLFPFKTTNSKPFVHSKKNNVKRSKLCGKKCKEYVHIPCLTIFYTLFLLDDIICGSVHAVVRVSSRIILKQPSLPQATVDCRLWPRSKLYVGLLLSVSLD